MSGDEVREQVAAKVRDAYYHARDHGGTMHTASFDAADALRAAGLLREDDGLRRQALRAEPSKAELWNGTSDHGYEPSTGPDPTDAAATP